MVDNNITPQLVTVDVHRAFDPYEVDAATGLYRLENGQKVVKPEAEFKKSKEEATAYLKSWYETVYLPAFPNIEEREDVESWISRLERQAGKLEMPGFKLAISIAVDVSVDPAAVAGGICGEAYPGGTMLVAYTAKNPDYTRTGVAIRALAAEGITAEHSGFEAKLAERREAIAKPFDMSGLIAHAETEVRDMMKFQGVEGRGSVWELDPLEGIKWARVADRASLDAMRAKIEKADVALPELDEAHLRFPLWVNEEDGAMSSMDPAERVKAAARNGFSVELPVRHVQPPLGVGQESVPLVLLWHGESLSKDVMGDVARWQYDYYAALLPEKLVAGETRDEIFLGSGPINRIHMICDL